MSQGQLMIRGALGPVLILKWLILKDIFLREQNSFLNTSGEA
jgi:hypothetical protein